MTRARTRYRSYTNWKDCEIRRPIEESANQFSRVQSTICMHHCTSDSSWCFVAAVDAEKQGFQYLKTGLIPCVSVGLFNFVYIS